ncbi:MAG: tetratricopeptide repeat protein [Acidobacteria bacterium]|nr:tetratricopeptide repeat protein [Acidobacteriota bacterium]
MQARWSWLGVVVCALLRGQNPDPVYPFLEKAYAALRGADYEEAVARFREAAETAPERPAIRKDLAYTLLKIGEREGAREQFSAALRLDPEDAHLALEYAFLCYETSRQAEARRLFDRLRHHPDPAVRATAGRAFDSIDQALAEGIRRWSEAVARSPGNYSAHYELATLAEQRDELALAAEHYQAAYGLRPGEQALLLDLGRVWHALGQTERALAAYRKAAGGSEPRVAEAAREYLPEAASVEARAAHDAARTRSLDAREMAERSYEAGYLNDALRYLKLAHEANPADFTVMLQLGRTYNLLRDDAQAARWFALARKSPDPRLAREAGQGYRNLRPAVGRFRSSAWVYPFFSSRWHDVFSYGQVRTEIRLGQLPVRPYLSVRFIGDTRRTTSEALPQYLSESSFLLATGLTGSPWPGVTLWAEAGAAASYLRRPQDRRLAPDFRGGVALSRGLGRLLGGEGSGLFAETSADGVYISRFQNDFLVYWQNRYGYTLPVVGRLEAQLCWNSHLTADTQRQYWANFLELGPGLRWRWRGLPGNLVFSVHFLRGVYTRNQDNPRGPNFFDLRAGFAYAFTR